MSFRFCTCLHARRRRCKYVQNNILIYRRHSWMSTCISMKISNFYCTYRFESFSNSKLYTFHNFSHSDNIEKLEFTVEHMRKKSVTNSGRFLLLDEIMKYEERNLCRFEENFATSFQLFLLCPV